ncbi:MAG: TetR/AcrR family transcriptional regulator of autoinduction and epiphytic fitness [Candidatus Azotimanducaceae bacterium]|jgi:TetR/AcrR family transcriptional regulator of autoinduction and epiphytic fitness|tara:strand:+ start:294 stop:917 length:624 start_codon:yes stop_codon:yes gene_type:complete
MTLDANFSDPDAPEIPDVSVDPRIERSRQAVLDAAVALLFDSGPDEVTHAKVAAAAEVSRTTVYKHYPHRSDLLHATLQAVGKHVPPASRLSGIVRDDLITLLTNLASDLRDEGRTKLIAVMIERALHDDTVRTVRDRFIAELVETFTAIVRLGEETGQLRAGVAPMQALGSMAGSLLFYRLLANQAVDDQLLADVVDSFVAAHAPA